MKSQTKHMKDPSAQKDPTATRSWLKTLMLPISIPVFMIAGGVAGTISGMISGTIGGGLAGYIHGSTSNDSAKPLVKHQDQIISALQSPHVPDSADWGKKSTTHIKAVKKFRFQGIVYGLFGAIIGSITGALTGLFAGSVLGGHTALNNTQKGKKYFYVISTTLKDTVRPIIEKMPVIKKIIAIKDRFKQNKIPSPLANKPSPVTAGDVFLAKMIIWVFNTLLDFKPIKQRLQLKELPTGNSEILVRKNTNPPEKSHSQPLPYKLPYEPQLSNLETHSSHTSPSDTPPPSTLRPQTTLTPSATPTIKTTNTHGITKS